MFSFQSLEFIPWIPSYRSASGGNAKASSSQGSLQSETSLSQEDTNVINYITVQLFLATTFCKNQSFNISQNYQSRPVSTSPVAPMFVLYCIQKQINT